MADYGEKVYDLSTARTNERIPVPPTRYIAIVEAADEATLKVGSKSAIGFDPRDYNSLPLETPTTELYLTNAAGTGELRFIVTDGSIQPQPATQVRKITEITGQIESNVTDRAGRVLGEADVTDRTGRDIGKARLMDDSGTLISESNPLPIQDPNQSGLEHGQQDVAAAGTAEALNGGTGLSVPGGGIVKVRGHTSASSDRVYVGSSTVDASNGYVLGDGDTVELHVDDVSTIFVDADTAGDGVSWVVEA